MRDGAPIRRRRLAAIALLLLLGGAAAVSRGRGLDARSESNGPPPSSPEAAASRILVGSGLRRVRAGGRDDLAEAGKPRTGTAPRVVGIVLDESYRPAAGVSVTVEGSASRELAPQTDAQGRFSVEIDRRGAFAWIGVFARGSSGQCATASTGVGPGCEIVDVGALVLGPGATLEVHATALGHPLPGAEVHVSTCLPYAPPPDVDVDGWPFLGWTHAGRTDASGLARMEGVPLGDVRVLVRAGGRWSGEAHASVESSSVHPVRVACESARDVEVSVFEGEGETPAAGATLWLLTEQGYSIFGPGGPLVTDPSGRVVLPAVPRDAQRIVQVCDAGDWFGPEEGDWMIPPRATTFLVHLRRISGRSRDAKRPDLAPPEPPRTPRRLQVRVGDAGGGVADGCEVRVAGPGLGELGETIPLDAEGFASRSDLDPGTYQVRAETGPEFAAPWERGRMIRGWDASVDLSGGDGRLEIVVPAREEAVVFVRTDGTPGLPAGARVHVGSSPGMPSGLRIDADRGEIHLPLRPSTSRTTFPLSLWILTPHHGAAHARLTRDGNGPMSAALDLRATGRLLLRARLEPGRDAGSSEGIEIQRSTDIGPFAPWKGYAEDRRNDRPDLLYLGVPPGRYRARDRYTGRVSEPVDVVAGSEPTVLFLDVSRSQVVEGAIELPDDLAPEKARVLVLGDGIDPEDAHPPITVTAPDRFRVTIPGDRPVRLVPAAEGCVPDPTLPEVVLESATPGLRLRLVRGIPR